MNIEQVCKDAIAVVESYLANDAPAYDMYDELHEASEAVDCAWDVCNSRKSHYICSNAWHACLAAKYDKRDIAEACIAKFKESL